MRNFFQLLKIIIVIFSNMLLYYYICEFNLSHEYHVINEKNAFFYINHKKIIYIMHGHKYNY